MFIREERLEEEIEITGNPAFDRITDPEVIQLVKICEKPADGTGDG